MDPSQCFVQACVSFIAATNNGSCVCVPERYYKNQKDTIAHTAPQLLDCFLYSWF